MASSSDTLAPLGNNIIPFNDSFRIYFEVHISNLPFTLNISTLTYFLTLFQHLLHQFHRLVVKVKGILFEFINNLIGWDSLRPILMLFIPSDFIFYHRLFKTHLTFSLYISSIFILSHLQEAHENPKWRVANLEEMNM